MQINGIGNNQIGNSYQNPNRMPNSATNKKEDDEASKRLEALGVKVELSFRQPPAQEQEAVKATTESEQPRETFSVLAWVKKIWEAGIAWLKSIWNDESTQEKQDGELEGQETVVSDITDARLVEETVLEEETATMEVQAGNLWETPAEENAAAMSDWEQFPERLVEAEQEYTQSDRFRTVGVPLHTSGMQDSYNRYGQHSKLGVEPSNNMTIRK